MVGKKQCGYQRSIKSTPKRSSSGGKEKMPFMSFIRKSMGTYNTRNNFDRVYSIDTRKTFLMLNLVIFMSKPLTFIFVAFLLFLVRFNLSFSTIRYTLFVVGVYRATRFILTSFPTRHLSFFQSILFPSHLQILSLLPSKFLLSCSRC